MGLDQSNLFESAKEEIEKKKPREEFELKDLLEDYGWDSLPETERKKLGKAFKKQVEDDKYPDIEIAEKGSDNHQKYKKK